MVAETVQGAAPGAPRRGGTRGGGRRLAARRSVARWGSWSGWPGAPRRIPTVGTTWYQVPSTTCPNKTSCPNLTSSRLSSPPVSTSSTQVGIFFNHSTFEYNLVPCYGTIPGSIRRRCVATVASPPRPPGRLRRRGRPVPCALLCDDGILGTLRARCGACGARGAGDPRRRVPTIRRPVGRDAGGRRRGARSGSGRRRGPASLPRAPRSPRGVPPGKAEGVKGGRGQGRRGLRQVGGAEQARPPGQPGPREQRRALRVLQRQELRRVLQAFP